MNTQISDDERQAYRVLFKGSDRYHDGRLNVQEVAILLRDAGKFSTLEEAQEMFQKFDVNRDNKLDLDEFIQLCKSLGIEP